MKQSTLARWLKAIVAGVGVCGALVYGLVLPTLGRVLAVDWGLQNGGNTLFWVWLAFLLGTAPAVYAGLVFAWKVAANIGRDRSFSRENAVLLRRIAILAAGDTVYFFLGVLILTLVNWSSPGAVLLSFFVDFTGVAVTVAAAALSHLVLKAAELQEQNDLTI